MRSRVERLFATMQGLVVDRTREIAKTYEADLVAAGKALKIIVDRARESTHGTKDCLRSVTGDGDSGSGIRNLVAAQQSAATSYAEDVATLVKEQLRLATGAVSLSNKIVDLGQQIGDVAFQSRLLSLNASVEAGRLGEDGAAFGVIATEMTRLAHTVESTNKAISEIAGQLLESLPKIAAQAQLLETRSSSHSVEVLEQSRTVWAAADELTTLLTERVKSGDQEFEQILDASLTALSHLQFHDVLSQQLTGLQRELHQMLARDLTEREADALPEASLEYEQPQEVAS